jgi:ADP-heptose:LPS heptosyltransferase
MILPLADLEPIGPFAEPRPNMRGRYLIRNAKKAAAMAVIDAVLSVMPRRTGQAPANPKRILVANWAHLGDVTTTIGALRALRHRYPDAQIGMLVGSWGRIAIDGVGLVDRIHVVDHPMLNRADVPRAEKQQRYRETKAVALNEMRAAGYDIGIDLFAFFPPAHPLFRQAGIPVRVGYISGGLGPLLTHPVRWSDEERPMADQYRDLLDQLDPATPFDPALFRPYRDRTTLAPLPLEIADIGRYIVIHPGAGAATRHWGTERWAAVMGRLGVDAPDYRLVLTGSGAADIAIAEELSAQFPKAVNLAGRANWEAFVRTLADAALVVCPDTATGHVAGLFSIPTVVIFTGTNSPAKWAPYNEQVRILVRPVTCAPCNRWGCEVMACFRGVLPEAVAEAALQALQVPATV